MAIDSVKLTLSTPSCLVNMECRALYPYHCAHHPHHHFPTEWIFKPNLQLSIVSDKLMVYRVSMCVCTLWLVLLCCYGCNGPLVQASAHYIIGRSATIHILNFSWYNWTVQHLITLRTSKGRFAILDSYFWYSLSAPRLSTTGFFQFISTYTLAFGTPTPQYLD